MNKGGIGVGSASIVLVFAVLCLTIFSLITFIVARNSKALVDAEAELVIGYYEADVEAERILAELVDSPIIPWSIRGVFIHIEQDNFSTYDIVNFSVPIYLTNANNVRSVSTMELFVRVAIIEDTYNILSWRMFDTANWTPDDGLNVILLD
jgi:hypothetical protein